MSTTTPWYVLPAARRRLTLPLLPSDAPLAARCLHSALPALTPAVTGDIRAGHLNSRRVRTALAQLAETSPGAVKLTRPELARAVRYLIEWNARTGALQ